MAGRKKIVWDEAQREQFKELCSMFCTRDDICGIMNVNKDTLTRLINDNFRYEVSGQKSKPITFKDAFEYFCVPGKVSLRRKQFEIAMSGNASMLIYLGKCYLGQTDKTENEDEEEAQSQITVFRQNSPVNRSQNI